MHADQILNFVKKEKTDTLRGPSLEEVLELVMNGHEENSLLTEKEDIGVEERKTFPNIVNELRDNLAEKNLGSLVSAKAFLKILEVARKASKEEGSKVLGSKKNQKIL